MQTGGPGCGQATCGHLQSGPSAWESRGCCSGTRACVRGQLGTASAHACRNCGAVAMPVCPRDCSRCVALNDRKGVGERSGMCCWLGKGKGEPGDPVLAVGTGSQPRPGLCPWLQLSTRGARASSQQAWHLLASPQLSGVGSPPEPARPWHSSGLLVQRAFFGPLAKEQEKSNTRLGDGASKLSQAKPCIAAASGCHEGRQELFGQAHDSGRNWKRGSSALRTCCALPPCTRCADARTDPKDGF